MDAIIIVMNKRTENKVFLYLCGMVLSVGILTFVKPQSGVSIIENRTLAKFEQFNVVDFLNGSFQENFESALSDQFLFSEAIRSGYGKMITKLSSFGVKDLVCEGHYLELPNSVDRRRATFNCEDYMLYWPEKLTAEKQDTVMENIQKYSSMNKASDMYYYFVNDSSVYNFEKNEKEVDYVELLKKNMLGEYKIDEFDYEDYDNYKQYFYKTDHHWDYRGSYQGYLDIVDLLGITCPVKYISTGTNHEFFFGSFARNTNNFSVEEEFVYYVFKLKPHDTLINGTIGKYGHFEEYSKHEYEYNKLVNYYAYYYGGDEGEIVFDYHQPDEGNLLIISNSYSNPINEIIASSFNKTFVVDTRHYRQFMGEDFVFSRYVRENKIDKVLVIMSPTFVMEAESNQGLEN